MAQGRFFDAAAQSAVRLLTVGVGAGSGPQWVSGGFTGGSAATIRLATVLPDPSDTSITEPSGNGYAHITGANKYINTATNASVSNANAWPVEGITGGGSDPWTITNSGGGLRFPEATGSWGTIYAVVFCSHTSTPAISNLICYFELDTPVTIGATDIFQIDEGELSFSFGDLVTY